MNDEPTPIVFETIEPDLHGGGLSGVWQGHRYPLFVFTPLREACLGHYAIAFAPDWQEYDKAFALLYLPVPFLDQSVAGRPLGKNVRAGDTVRPWTQATYKGWPLYYVSGHDTAVKPGDFPVMFGPATVDIEEVFPDGAPVSAGSGVPTLPGPSLGP
jgi:hypothetical protein